ncbi:hypothetical protein D3C77_674510 [compost metagenome]
MGQQMVDLRDQGFELAGHLCVELRALALLQLSNLHAYAFEWTQRSCDSNALQDQHQDQRNQPHSQADLLHAPKLIPHRGVILSHADCNGLTKAPVVAAQYQQLLVFGP